MRAALAQRILSLLPQSQNELPQGVTVSAVFKLVQEALGDNLKIFADGRMLIWDIARHDGYNIPAYPMAGCGDIKEFLADEGARNVPDWYKKHLGMNREAYDSMYLFELVMVRNLAFWRKVYEVPSAVMHDREDHADALYGLIYTWLDFALGQQTGLDDPRLFKR